MLYNKNLKTKNMQVRDLKNLVGSCEILTTERHDEETDRISLFKGFLNEVSEDIMNLLVIAIDPAPTDSNYSLNIWVINTDYTKSEAFMQYYEII